MNNSIADAKLAEISKLIARKMGLYFPPDRWPDLVRNLSSCAHDSGYKDLETYAQHLLTSPLTKEKMEELATYFTIGETYFFREKESLETLRNHIFPDLVHSHQGIHRNIKIWSAGCCTGEEPYSIAILFSQSLPSLKNAQIQILATDINPHFLQKAMQGVYKEFSFRGTPQWIKEKMFHCRKDGTYQIIPAIQKMVSFHSLNLAEDNYDSPHYVIIFRKREKNSRFLGIKN